MRIEKITYFLNSRTSSKALCILGRERGKKKPLPMNFFSSHQAWKDCLNVSCIYEKNKSKNHRNVYGA